MQDSKFVKGMLIFSGVLLIILGILYVFTPIEFYGNANQVDIVSPENSVNLLNEIRAAGGALLLGGIVVLMGGFKPTLAYASTMISIIIWTGYGLARIVSLMADGAPSEALVVVMIIELAIGGAGMFAIKKYGLEQTTG